MYIYEQIDWPNFTWDAAGLQPLLSEVRNLQGLVLGKMGSLGFDLANQANLDILTQDVIKSCEIEGEILDPAQVRSSIARRLGLEISGLVLSDRHVDGVVEMMLDATSKFDEPLTKDRLFGWHSALFPSGRSGMHRIQVGRWRTDSTGPMQVVSGALGKERVHFQAPPASCVDAEMKSFLIWLSSESKIDLVLKSALAHLWYITLHPFDDGNGRIARAITDMILSRSDKQANRFYSMSTQIHSERQQYYNVLEQTQKGQIDVSNWLQWFLECLMHALGNSAVLLEKVIFKHHFWMLNSDTVENDRQRKILNLMLDDFKGKLTTSKWAKIGKCSQDTALRDIQKLVDKEVLYKLSSGGRSTCYELVSISSSE